MGKLMEGSVCEALSHNVYLMSCLPLIFLSIANLFFIPTQSFLARFVWESYFECRGRLLFSNKYLVRGTMSTFLCLLVLIENVSSHDISAQLAAANGNTTTLKTQIAPGYVEMAHIRGTFEIVWSCLVTLTACIYSAIHHDVPAPNKGKWPLLLTKVGMAVAALLAPELVLFYA